MVYALSEYTGDRYLILTFKCKINIKTLKCKYNLLIIVFLIPVVGKISCIQ